jgi:hypothetical protein
LHIRDNPNSTENLEFPIILLANDLHTPYSTLYLSTLSLLAKWTIAYGIQQAPRDRFSDDSGKATLRAED